MASGGSGRKKDDKGNKGDVGGWLSFAGGAAVGAALLYGAKLLYDHYTSEDKPECAEEVKVKVLDDDDDNLYSEASSEPPDAEFSGLSLKRPTTSESSDDQTPLHDQLQDYYSSYVDVPVAEMEEAWYVVLAVKEKFVDYMQELMPNHPIGRLIYTGSTVEGLKVVHADEFDVMIPLELEHIDYGMWDVVNGADTLLSDADGHYLVKRQYPDREFFHPGSSAYDKYLVGDYLSPKKIKSAFQSMTTKVAKWGDEFIVRPSVIGPSVMLTVQYGNKKTLTIDFVPAVKIKDTWLVAKEHPKLFEQEPDESYKNLWRASYSMKEMEKLQQVKDQGCQLKCLKIIKAVRLNHPAQLGMFSSYVFKTIIMHLLDTEDEWSDKVLSERFIDVLLALDSYLSNRNLPLYFNEKVNLLKQFNPVALDNVRGFMKRIIGRNQVHKLFEKGY